MTTPEEPKEPENERRWHDNPLIGMSYGYTVLVILIVIICLVVWLLRS